MISWGYYPLAIPGQQHQLQHLPFPRVNAYCNHTLVPVKKQTISIISPYSVRKMQNIKLPTQYSRLLMKIASLIGKNDENEPLEVD